MSRSSRARTSHGQHAAPGATVRAAAPHPVWCWIMLFGFVAIRFGPTLGIPFLSDDYVFPISPTR